MYRVRYLVIHVITVTGIAAPHFYGRRALSSAVLTNHITLDLLSSSLSILSTFYPFYSLLSTLCTLSLSCPPPPPPPTLLLYHLLLSP